LQLVAIISQDNQPLAFHSRKLSDAQTRYTLIELELLSIVETLQEFRSILLGHPINIYTDHKNLTFNNFTMDRVRRWRLIVEEYSPTIYYVKGVHNIIADMLSRVPRQDAPVPTIIETCFLMETEHFPLAFAIIAQAQADDKKLQKTLNQLPMEYKQHIHHEQLIIYFKNKIVIPIELQSRTIEWYHEQILHPGVLGPH